MAHSEATVRASPDGGEGTGARMVGGSLPPRKRLLAGLKQNSSWSASSSPALATPLSAEQRPEGGLKPATISTLTNSSSEGVIGGEGKAVCTKCGVQQSDAWRKTKRNGVLQRLCDACHLSSNRNTRCPKCQRYPDVKDAALWLECSRCQRFIHLECEHRPLPPTFTGPYMCPDCVFGKKDEEHVNPRTGAPSGRQGHTEVGYPSNKKIRVSRERSKSYDEEAVDACSVEEIPNSTNVLQGRKGSNSKEAAAAAAAAAAVLACRAAAAAKVSAAAKAAIAVKAAAIAKAALDAAAVAARIEAQVRTELRTNLAASQAAVFGDVKIDGSVSQLRNERSGETEVKTDGEEVQAVTGLSSIDDEELARQLHRVINSSPRICNGLTPLRRKPSTKPVAVVDGSPAVTSVPRLGFTTGSEPRSQMKQQQGRPRSLQLRDVKRIDVRDVKLESKPFSGSSRSKVSQQHSTGASGHASDLLVLKSEPGDSSTVTLAREESGNMLLQGATSTSLNSVEESPERVVPATDVSHAAALLDEVLSEAEEGEACKEHVSPVHDKTDIPVEEDRDASTKTIVEGPVSGSKAQLEEVERPECKDSSLRNDNVETANAEVSGVAALVPVASSAVDSLENQGTLG